MIPIRDFIFHDGTSYRNLIESIKNYTDELFIRHDVDSYLKYALKFAKLEKKCGYKSTYFLFEKDFNTRDRFRELGHDSGLHIRAGDTPPHIIPWTIHGEARAYEGGYSVPLKNNKSHIRRNELYISDSMGQWNCHTGYTGIDLSLWKRASGSLWWAFSHCFTYKPPKVHLLIHPNPLRWRPKYGPIRAT